MAVRLLSMMENHSKAFFCLAALLSNSSEINLSIALAGLPELQQMMKMQLAPHLDN
jgi:hypothetical protein